MTEDSTGWTTGGAGDGAATLTRQDWSDFMKILAACMDEEGVAPAYLNALACTANGSNSVRTATGGALVDGKPYWNTANVDTNIPSAVGGGNTRIDRIVLRADWTAQTVRITRIAGTDAASPSAPSITQTPGTTYDIKLCQALVNTSGAVTVTDERTFAQPGANSIPLTAIPDATLTAAKFVAGTLTANEIANRTRTFLAPAAPFSAVGNPSDGGVNQFGVFMPDLVELTAQGWFRVPADFVSTLTVTPIVQPGGTGNLRWNQNAWAGAVGESFQNHNHATADNTLAVTGNQINALTALSVSSAAAGDYISLQLTRFGDNAADTISNYMMLTGWLVSYTADS